MVELPGVEIISPLGIIFADGGSCLRCAAKQRCEIGPMGPIGPIGCGGERSAERGAGSGAGYCLEIQTRGESPVMLLKRWKKVAVSLKPEWAATCSMVASGWSSM